MKIRIKLFILCLCFLSYEDIFAQIVIGHVESSYYPSEESALEAVEFFRSECAGGAEFWVSEIYSNSRGYFFNWRCNACKSPMVISFVDAIRENCKNACYQWNKVECAFIADGGIVESSLECGSPVYYKSEDPDTHHCPYKEGESSSSSEELSSSSSEPSSSSSEIHEDEENSSSSGSGGSCFPSLGDAMIANSERTGECAASGGDASALEIVPQDDVWCLAGSCDCSDGTQQPMRMLRAAVQRTAVNSCEVPSSSSEEESSSSSGGESSSSSEEVSSSSSEEESSSSSEADGSSSNSGYVGESCDFPEEHWEYISDWGGFHKTLYPYKPEMSNANSIYVSNCACGNDNFFRCTVENFGYVHDYTLSGVSMCGYSHGYWCNGIENGSCNFTGKNAHIYYSDEPGYGWLVENIEGSSLFPPDYPSYYFGIRLPGNNHILFYHNFTLPFNVSTSDLESAILEALPDFPSLNKMNEYCRGEWVPHDEDCFGTQAEAEKAFGDSLFFCSAPNVSNYSISLSGRGWCVDGWCDVVDISSSSVEEVSSSSSEEISSSSSEGVSSSGGSDNCIEPPGYVSPPNGINTCIIKDNRCYVCNPDRGADCNLPWLWTGEQVNQEYWFKEVSCSEGGGESSSSSEEVCPSHPLLSVPSNPLNACFEKNGSCYKCNSERGSDCSNNWLWIYDFMESNVGYWYEEIDCGTSNFRSMFLTKKNLPETEKSSKEDISNDIWGNKTKFYYDALGRKTQAEPNTRRFLFTPASP